MCTRGGELLTTEKVYNFNQNLRTWEPERQNYSQLDNFNQNLRT